MLRRLPVLACLLLPCCLARVLWPHREPDRGLQLRSTAEFVVDAAATAPVDASTAPADAAPLLLLRTRHARGNWLYLIAESLAHATAFTFQFEDPATAPAVAMLLTAEPLGPIDHCALAVAWTRSPLGYEFWEGSIDLGGELANDAQDWAVHADAAPGLLALAVPPTDAVLPAIDTVPRVDWRVLVPAIDDGRGRVVACVPAEVAGELDLLVQIGTGPLCQFARVPASLLPVLAAVHRDSRTLLPRYVLTAHGRALPNHDDPCWLPLVHDRTLQLVSRMETDLESYSALERYVLRPLIRAVDAVAQWVLITLFPELFWHQLEAAPRPRHGR